MVGAIELPLDVAKERFDTLPEQGEFINFNGEEYLIRKVTLCEKETTTEIVVLLKVEPKRETAVVGFYSTEEEVREAAGELLGGS